MNRFEPIYTEESGNKVIYFDAPDGNSYRAEYISGWDQYWYIWRVDIQGAYLPQQPDFSFFLPKTATPGLLWKAISRNKDRPNRIHPFKD